MEIHVDWENITCGCSIKNKPLDIIRDCFKPSLACITLQKMQMFD